MKILKTLGFIILALIGIFLILGLVSRKDFKTSQSTVINASPQHVYGVVNDLSTWDSWSPWVEMDPTNVSTMGENYIGKGGYYTWVGEKTGSGKMEITESIPAQSIKTHLEFDGQGGADANFSFEPTEGGTKASWDFHSHVGFPMNAMMVLMGMEKTIDKSYTRGLELLKTKVEALPKGSGKNWAVQTVDYPGATYVMKREVVSMDKMSEFYQKNLPALFGTCEAAKLEMAGAPSGLYYSWDMEKQQSDMAAAIPVKENAKIPKGVEITKINPGKALQVDYYGPYENIKDAHNALEAHVKANNLNIGLPVIEAYVTDPETEKDPNKWLTQVVYPLQ